MRSLSVFSISFLTVHTASGSLFLGLSPQQKRPMRMASDMWFSLRTRYVQMDMCGYGPQRPSTTQRTLRPPENPSSSPR